MEKWNLSQLWDLVSYLACNPDARHEIASAAPLCAKAASAGDQVALGIYENAAMDLFIQARTAIELHREDWNGCLVIAGGAWKGCAHMFEVFKHQIELAYPKSTVEKPLFEPVAGCVVLRCLREGLSLTEIKERMTQSFKDFLYSEA
jgi:N-acetylglucosamine kinase-like BadF-type ATPase